MDNHRAKAAGISILSYVMFLGILFFMTISYTPQEDLIAMGVDLNYGVDLVGYGNNQTLNKANASPINEEMAPSGNEESKPQTVKKEPVKQPQQKSEIKSQKSNVSKRVITSNADKTPAISQKKTTSKSTTTATAPVQQRTTTVSPPPTPQRSVDESSIFKKRGANSNSNGTVGTQSGIGGNNNGDGKPGDVGDQGSSQGTLDGKSLYGKPGAGGTGGASVSISGWRKKSINLPTDKSNETGKIVFEVTVNDLGTLTRIKAIQSNVSPSVVKFYEDYLKRNLSSYLIPEGTPPANSSGRITILIKAGN